MAPHVHRLSGYASQRLVSLFDMLARKYSKSVELKNDKSIDAKGNQIEGGSISEDAVGTISTNGEREIGELIAKAMEKVGKEGVITVAVRVIGGLQSLGVDSLENFRDKIPSMRTELKDEQKFREIYNFAFGWAKEKWTDSSLAVLLPSCLRFAYEACGLGIVVAMG
ncbi:hypothetical protein Taro_003691 [Colocasia esculenta]|uniref:Dymeclin n=1 Tax=Colocasia esculenta TaxID=4460 RepID=A0A843TKH0_COLES|nr:hypothetical protein [Colocasia esculenta]